MEIIIGTQLSNVAAQTTLDLQGLITSMQASGMSGDAIKQTLMADLTGGGRLFGTFRNQVKNTVKSGIGMAGNNASRSTFTKAGVDQFQWVTVGGGNVCPDCEARHGQVEDMKYWELIGTPQSGFSVCQQNCRCQLLPESYKGENLDKPLLREKKVSVTTPKMAGKHKTVADAVKWAEKNGVIHHQLDKMPLEYVNSINEAITHMPKKYQRDLVIGDFNYFRKVTGRSFKKHQLKNYGVSITIDGFDAQILSLKEKIALNKEGSLGQYNIVALNKSKYKNLNDITDRKIMVNKKYLNKTGKNYSFNLDGRATIHHEFGHIIHNNMSVELHKEWDIIARNWANDVDYDLLKIKSAWTESYSEAFSEAWGAYQTGKKSRLPSSVVDFLEKL